MNSSAFPADKEQPPKDTKETTTFGNLTVLINKFNRFVGGTPRSKLDQDTEEMPRTRSNISNSAERSATNNEVPASSTSPHGDRTNTRARALQTTLKNKLADDDVSKTPLSNKDRFTTAPLPPATSEAIHRGPIQPAIPKLSQPVKQPANLSKRKRPLPKPHVDEPQPSPEESRVDNNEAESGVNKRTRKPAQSRRLAKNPLVIAKTSQGSDRGHPQVKERLVMSSEAQKSTTIQGTSEKEPNGVEHPVDQHRTVSRKRGRPPKSKNKPAEPELVDKVGQSSSDAALRKSNARAQSNAVNERDPGADEGLDPILLNPSPVKPTPFQKKQAPTKPKTNPTKVGSTEAAQTNGSYEVNDSSDFEDGQRGEESATDPLSSRHKRASSSQSRLFCIEPKIIREMLDQVKRVGYKYKNNGGTWSQVEKWTTPSTGKGKMLDQRLKELTKEYDCLRLYCSDGDLDGAELAQGKIAKMVDEVKDESLRIISEHLGDLEEVTKAIREERAQILVDLYFISFPLFVDTIEKAVDAYGSQGDMSSSALREIVGLVEGLIKLAEKAMNQPKDLQPRPETGSYQIRQPTRRLLPLLRNFLTMLLEEVDTRKRRERMAEAKGAFIAYEKLRQEEDKKLELARRQRIRDIHRSQKQDLAEKFADPLLARLIRAQMEKEVSREATQREEFEVKKRAASRMRSQMSRAVGNLSSQGYDRFEDVNAEDDPFADEELDQPVERVALFGKNNTRGIRRPWSDREKVNFIEIMRNEQGTKYLIG